jgi:Tfp pilus assembly protein PilX
MNTRKTSQQKGIVSIMMTLVLMLVISLIVIGLAQITRREQRLSLDDHLSVQAYYAAESGVNDTYRIISNMLMTSPGTPIPSKTTCDNDSAYDLGSDSLVNKANDVSFTCVLVTANPSSLHYTLGSNGQVIPLQTSTTGGSVADFDITWSPPTGAQQSVGKCPDFNTFVSLPQSLGECGFGGLEYDLVPMSTPVSRSTLISSAKTGYVIPSSSNGTRSFDYKNDSTGNIQYANCQTGTCSFTIKDLTANKYYIRLIPLYASKFNVVLSTIPGFINAQATIDVTGEAQDVLRRIKVAFDITNNTTPTNATDALMTDGSICKQFQLTSGGSISHSGGSDNPLCMNGSRPN